MNYLKEMQLAIIKYLGIILLSVFINIPVLFVTFGFAFFGSPLMFSPILIYLIIGIIVGWQKPKENAMRISVALTILSVFLSCILSLYTYLQESKIACILWAIISFCYWLVTWSGIIIGNKINMKLQMNNEITKWKE
jgi:hypothetical protein